MSSTAVYRASWSSKTKGELDRDVAANVEHLQTATNHHMGYAYNLDFEAQLYPVLYKFLLNHLGEPEQGGQYAVNVFEKELEVVDIFKQLWGGNTLNEPLWGYVSSSGTENNLWAIHHGVTVQLKRHPGCDPVILCSEQGHYSFDKGGNLTRIKMIKVCSNSDGSISLSDLKDKLQANKDAPIILGLVSGTTIKEGHDDIESALKLIKETNRSRDDFYILIDGALSATFLPLVNAPYNINPGFWHDVDSISTSGHKFIGCPIPCGILVMKKKHNLEVAKAVEYIKSNDTTMAGSRSGFAVYFLWLRLHALGADGLEELALSGIKLAGEIAERFRKAGIDVLHNTKALTVYFPKPSVEIIDKYSLACKGDHAHIICLGNTLDTRSKNFVGASAFADEYLVWWANAGRN